MIGRMVKAYTEPATIADQSTSAEDFLTFLDTLYDLACSYPAGGDPNDLALDFLRHEEYSSYQWRSLVGSINDGFVAYAKDAGLRLLRSYADPLFGVAYKTSHFGAACSGTYRYGGSADGEFNRGDITGWAGDWITFYADWRRDSESNMDGMEYCSALLARSDQTSTFMLSDLIEDADAYTIGMLLHGGLSLPEAARTVFSTPRLNAFYAARFRDDDGLAYAVARQTLLGGEDTLVTFGRIYLIQSIGGLPTTLPVMLPSESIDFLCRGFVEVIRRRMRQEHDLLKAALG